MRRALSSSLSTLASYPLDTYKVHKLMNATLVPGALFSGVEAPLIVNSVSDCIRLTVFEGMTGHGVVAAAALAGVVNALLSIPLDSYKLSRQLHRRMTLRGWQGIMAKEIVGSTVYLTSVRYVQQLQPGIIETAAYGGLCGMLAVTCVYPLDSIRIKHQAGNCTLGETLSGENAASVWRGYSFAISKAFVQSAVMVSLLTFTS